MIKLTTRELLGAMQEVAVNGSRPASALGSLRGAKIPGAEVYKVMEIFDYLDAAYERFEQARMRLLEQHAETVPEAEGEEATFAPGAREQFMQELNALLDYRFTLPVDPIDRRTVDRLDLTVDQIGRLRFLISGAGERAPAEFDPFAEWDNA